MSSLKRSKFWLDFFVEICDVLSFQNVQWAQVKAIRSSYVHYGYTNWLDHHNSSCIMLYLLLIQTDLCKWESNCMMWPFCMYFLLFLCLTQSSLDKATVMSRFLGIQVYIKRKLCWSNDVEFHWPSFHAPIYSFRRVTWEACVGYFPANGHMESYYYFSFSCGNI